MNGSFFARYYAYIFKRVLRRSPHIIVIYLILCVLIFTRGTFSIKNVLFGLGIGLILTLLVFPGATLILTSKHYSLYKILDEKGFCIEYLRVYEQKRITGKPFNIQYALEYAEIFMHIGKPDEAIKYLNTLTIPPNANVLFQAEYFYLYVLCALKIGNLAIAEDMWSKGGDLIAKISANPKLCETSGQLMIFAIICTDCYAARQNGDRTRLERAYQQTENFLNNHKIEDNTSFRIIWLYELRELGLMERYNTSLSKIRNGINESNLLFRYVKNIHHENLDCVEKGGLPFLPS